MERRLSSNLPVALLIVATVAAAALILVLVEDLTYFGDTWSTLMRRREFTADALLDPHNEHIVVFPVLITQVILRIFGMTSAMPEFVALVIALSIAAGLLFVYVKRRVGPWLALFAAVLVLFLGPAWEVLLWTFEIGYVGSVLFGLAMLLALEREDRRGDLAACAFLALSLGFSSLGIPFAVAALVALALGPRQGWLPRAYVFAIPVALFAVWYLGWGHEADSHLSLRNVLVSPRFVAEQLAYGVGALFGLGPNPTDGGTDPVWGRAIVVAIVVAIGVYAYRRFREPGFYPGLWPVAAAAATNWFLTAFNAFPGRDPGASRYQYASVVFIVMILANLLREFRFGTRAVIAAAAVTVFALGPNLVLLKDGRDGFFLPHAILTKADTAAIEIARETVAADFALTPEVAGTPTLIDINAASYLSAVDRYGSPAYTETELASAPESGRRQADIVLSQALPLSTVTRLGDFRAVASECTELASGGENREVALGAGTHTIEVAPGGQAELALRRFAADEYPVPITSVPGDSVTELVIPADTSPRRWHLSADAEQLVRVCRRSR